MARTVWGPSAAVGTDLGSCRLGNSTFGKLPLGKIPSGSSRLGLGQTREVASLGKYLTSFT